MRARDLSVPTATVPPVNPDDVVDPGDAALQALLAAIAERTPDREVRDTILNFILTLPPLRHWPSDSIARLHNVANVGAGLARQLNRTGWEHEP